MTTLTHEISKAASYGPVEAIFAFGLTCKHRLAYSLSSYRMDDLYRAIADPTRRAILDELVERDGQSLFELCGRLVMMHGISSSRQAISQHLEVLEGAGLVIAKRDGRYKFHWFNGEPLKSISERWPVNEQRSEDS